MSDRRQAWLGRARQRLGPPSPRRTNIGLLWLLVAAVATGVVAFGLGTGWVRWAVVAHGVAGLGLVVLAPAKWAISRRGLARRSVRSTWPSLLLAVLTVATVLSGIGHTLGLVLTWGPLDDMQVHVGSAVLLVVVAAWHVLARGQVPARRDLDRRNLVRSGVVLGTAGVVFGAGEVLARVAGWPGSRRRFTGSFEQGSHDPAAMPSIIWLADPRLELDAADWTLTVTDERGTTSLGHADLARGVADLDRVTAVLDCTSGWWAEQDWYGVRLDQLVRPGAGDRSVVVRSATGYHRRFPVEDLSGLLLATHYEGRPLADRHGFPARLVAPGRRGFWWVKWVVEVTTEPTPWPAQSPFPLQ